MADFSCMPLRKDGGRVVSGCHTDIARHGSLSQEAENPAHNRAYPGSRPGGATRFIGGITMINNPVERLQGNWKTQMGKSIQLLV